MWTQRNVVEFCCAYVRSAALFHAMALQAGQDVEVIGLNVQPIITTFQVCSKIMIIHYVSYHVILLN